MQRRKFLHHTVVTTLGTYLTPQILKATAKIDPTILVVSGWQDVNIGDIAHTPGLLHVLETFLPNAKIILWKVSRGKETEALISRNFPKIRIIYGGVDREKMNVESQDVLAAFEESDILVHGSGPSVVARANLQAWHKKTGKPFGVFGVTIQTINPELEILLKKASFIHTRETQSLEVLKNVGISEPNISFAPDATFFLNIRNEKLAEAFLRKNKLEAGKFICAVPRLRITPAHTFARPNWSDERIKEVETLNANKKEVDHAKLREAMVMWVRETGNKVLVCPEMTYQVGIMDELLIDPLPDDVKPFVVKRGYWMPDETASVYSEAHTVLSFECHSPIIAAANGTPFFYLRQPEDTIKGHMYYDLGFNDWVFEIEETSGKQIADQLRKVFQDYSLAKQRVERNRINIEGIYKYSCATIQKLVKE